MKELLEKILAEIKKTPGGMTAYEDLYHICIETKKTDAGLAVKYLKLLSDCIERQIPAVDSDRDLHFLFNLHKKVLLAAAPLDFESYLLYVEWNREPEKKFYVPRREVLRPIVQAMQDMIDDTVPEGGTVTVKDDSGTTTITLPSGGTVKPDPEDGTVPLPGGAVVVDKDGETITVPEGGGTYHPDGTVTQDVCTVTFNSQGGSAVEDAKVTYGKTVSKPTDPTKEGYTFNGWYHEKECTNTFAFDTYMITSDVTLYAGWTGKHVHSFGSKWKSDASGHWKECECGEKADQAAHTPGDWIIDQEATATAAGSKHKECSVCGYVTETGAIPQLPPEHTHSYGKEWKSDASGHWKECECGEKADQAAHTPGDWIIDQEATTTTAGSKHKECSVCGYVTETGTIDRLPAPVPSVYTLRFDTQVDGLTVSSQSVTEGGKAAKPNAPARSGYTFGGWYKESGCVTAWDFDADVVNQDMTLYAKWSKKATSSRPSSGRPSRQPEPEPDKPTMSDFTDVAQDAWYYDAVEYAVSHELFNGTSDTTFSPNATMTRAMLMTVLARLDGQETEGGNTWYAKGMAWAVTQAISDGTAPEAPITREQLAAMLYRYAKAGKPNGNLSGFTDAASVSDWAKDAVTWAVEQGIIQGKGGGILDPKGEATRAEVAQMLKNFMTSEEVQA